ncbi:hypothetical protein LTR36_005821 [Oleoguttula mirabilis]|uniref:Zn(2)-C6 fungal-type domain-containing protein n=1 Tax=Oleoguttula mirabilis TaxID=1507867 RepID=A0AAV9JD08_9PEZI|nr:hypothetical protein LTR36_005821 [Oleoguttula mirabilis]
MADFDDVLDTPTGVPIYELWRQATRSEAAATVFLIVVFLCGIFALIGSMQTSSRLTWAFGRDNALLYSSYFGQISPTFGVPIYALLFNSFVIFIIGCVYLGSSTAFNAILSTGLILQQVSFAFPVMCLMLRRRSPKYLPSSRSFRLGPLGWLANVVTVAFAAIVLVFYCFPVEMPVTGSSMNYACVVLGAMGCYNCMKRRIICDCTPPKCQKCQKKGLDCPGIGSRIRFNDGIASRGKLKGRNVPTLAASTTAPQLDKDRLTSLLPNAQALVVTPPMLEMPLEILDAKTRMLFAHFSESVSPVMVFLDEVNGYRHHILPFACSDPVVQRAVCVTAAFHLSAKVPGLRQPAEAGKTAIITKLREMAVRDEPSAVLNHSTWAIILLLMVADLVVAGDDMQTLFNMLVSISKAKGADSCGNGNPLPAFLQEQTELLKLFAGPIISEQRGIELLSLEAAPHMSFISTLLERADPAKRPALLQTDEAWRQARAIYLRRAISSGPASSSTDTTDTILAVETLRRLLLTVDPTAPAAHSLVWPYFVAGAESTTEEHKEFFKGRLEYLLASTGYANVRVALDTLRELWAGGAEERWTARLPKTTSVIIM